MAPNQNECEPNPRHSVFPQRHGVLGALAQENHQKWSLVRRDRRGCRHIQAQGLVPAHISPAPFIHLFPLFFHSYPFFGPSPKFQTLHMPTIPLETFYFKFYTVSERFFPTSFNMLCVLVVDNLKATRHSQENFFG